MMKKILLVVFMVFSALTTFGERVKIYSGREVFYFIDTNTLEVTVNKGPHREILSIAQNNLEPTNVLKSNNKISFDRNSKKFSFKVIKDRLDISITATKTDDKITFPQISKGVENFILPLYQGKRIPTKDKKFKNYLIGKGEEIFSERFSMAFFSSEYKYFNAMIVVGNIFNNTYKFTDNEGDIQFNLTHTFPIMESPKTISFSIYILPKDIKEITATYRNLLIKNKDFKTLEEKAQINPNVKKLYGASHFYLWGLGIITAENVKDPKGLYHAFKKDLKIKEDNIAKKIYSGLKNYDEKDEFTKNLKTEVKEYYSHNVNIFIKGINHSLEQKNLLQYPKQFSNSDKILKNKYEFYNRYRKYLNPLDSFGDGVSNYILTELKNNNIDRAWLGDNNDLYAIGNPEVVKRANKMGYLFGVYDSYHTIVKPGAKAWSTVEFNNKNAYDNNTITGRNGEKIKGFQQTGRKLNPSTTIPLIKDRIDKILSNGVEMNSWFLDVDATGEFHNDYTPSRMSTQKDDMNARIKKMNYISKNYNMVLGSETGMGFSSKYISFAHGMTRPLFGWGDKDLRKNKASKYYLGKYYSPTGGVPALFEKEVPLKDIYSYVYFNNKFNLPLYQLVYNDSVITTHHWTMGSLKFKGQRKNNYLMEISYNIPPLYHLDRRVWRRDKKYIVPHAVFFSKWHKILVKLPMTNFEYLSSDNTLQKTEFGKRYSIITNYSTIDKFYNGEKIKKQSLIILDHETGKKEKYSPK